MKKTIVILILTVLLGSFWQTAAQTSEQLTLRINNQKKFAGGKLTVKFVSLAEDSRCPIGVNCIHAGNAKIQIKVAKRGGAAKTFDLNTDMQPAVVSFEGYDIKLTNLVPVPRENVRINRNGYTATLAISKSANAK